MLCLKYGTDSEMTTRAGSSTVTGLRTARRFCTVKRSTNLMLTCRKPERAGSPSTPHRYVANLAPTPQLLTVLLNGPLRPKAVRID
jgi:hypothetical protein